jgi:hypothetical protein
MGQTNRRNLAIIYIDLYNKFILIITFKEMGNSYGILA